MQPSHLCDQRLQTVNPEHTILTWKLVNQAVGFDKDKAVVDDIADKTMTYS